MISFLGGIVEMVFGLVDMVLSLAFGLIEMVFGLLGGLASLLFSLAGFALVIALVVVFIRRRGKKKAEPDGQLVDDNGEVFTSFYHQQAE